MLPGFAPGDVVDGRYRIEAPLGGGGMGEVLRATDLGRGVPVALKVLAGALSLDADAGQRFAREAALAAHVDREPGVVRVWSAGRHRGRQFLVMELVEGEDLERASRRGLAPEALARLVADVARTVGRCHARGVVHRDLKPANVLLRAADGAPLVTDFGMAWAATAERLTRTGDLLGTPSYMAPEQVLDPSRAHDPAVDVYALGAVLYQGLTGRPPFEGGVLEVLRRVLEEPPVRPTALRPAAPAALEAICLRAMSKAPARRQPSADALADDLERWLAGDRAGPPRARRALPATALALVAVLAGGAALVVARRRPDRADAGDAAAALVAEALKRGEADPLAGLRRLEPLLAGGGAPRARAAAAALWRQALARARHPDEVTGYPQARLGPLAGEDLTQADGRFDALRAEGARAVARLALTGDPRAIAAAHERALALAASPALPARAEAAAAKARAFDEDADAWASALREAWPQRAERVTALLEVLGLALRAAPATAPGPRLTSALDEVTDAFAQAAEAGEAGALQRVAAFDVARLRLIGPAAPPDGFRRVVQWRLISEREVVPWLIAAGLRCGFVPNNVDRSLGGELLAAIGHERAWGRAIRYVEFRRARERAVQSAADMASWGVDAQRLGSEVLASGLTDDLAPRYVGEVHVAVATAEVSWAEHLAGPSRRRSADVLALVASAVWHVRRGQQVDPADPANFREGWRTLGRALALLQGPEVLEQLFSAGVRRAEEVEGSPDLDEVERGRWRTARGTLHLDRAAHLALWGDPTEALRLARAARELLSGDDHLRAIAVEALTLVAERRLDEAEATLAPRLSDGLRVVQFAAAAVEVAARAERRELAQERLRRALASIEDRSDREALQDLGRRLGL